MNAYRFVYVSGKRRRAHRVVMEGVLGRVLREDEVVHHENRMRGDNRPENLRVMSTRDHVRVHLGTFDVNLWCVVCATPRRGTITARTAAARYPNGYACSALHRHERDRRIGRGPHAERFAMGS